MVVVVMGGGVVGWVFRARGGGTDVKTGGQEAKPPWRNQRCGGRWREGGVVEAELGLR